MVIICNFHQRKTCTLSWWIDVLEVEVNYGIRKNKYWVVCLENGRESIFTGCYLLISIILARLLSPSEYGVIALVNIFIVLANIFVTNGFSASLIQNKNADALDFPLIYIVVWEYLVYSILLFIFRLHL